MRILTVEWQGKSGTINANEAFAAADAIEDSVTIYELAEMASDPRKLKVGKLAAAYASLCKHAGVPVNAQEVRRELAHAMAGALQGREDTFASVVGVIEPLYQILTDGAPKATGEEAPGNGEAPAS